eukprot:7152396-Pyramimonas_sp.AAC.1
MSKGFLCCAVLVQVFLWALVVLVKSTQPHYATFGLRASAKPYRSGLILTLAMQNHSRYL